MSLAKDFTELRQALLPRLEQENQDAGQIIPVGNATLGFHYLRYQRGDYTLREFLIKAGEEADGGVSDLDCESVYQLLNSIENTEASDVTEVANLRNELTGLFRHYGDRAEAEWAAVQELHSSKQ